MTTLQFGYTAPLTDTFGAHPVLGNVLDLNDGATFVLVSPDGLEIPPPPRTVGLTGNVRTQGERASRGIFRANREARISVILGPMANYAALVAAVRSLLAWVTAPPQYPVALKWQPPSASSPVYLDVVGATCSIPEDEGDWLRLQLEPIEIVCVCRPGMRGDRVTLQNLVMNPGFQAGSGLGVLAFSDPFNNADAYTVVSGSAPSVSANVLTIPPHTQLAFGSPSWGALNIWQCRFQWPGSGQLNFMLHYQSASQVFYVALTGTQLDLIDTVGGTAHTQANVGCTLTSGNWYWIRITQFPTAPSGAPCSVQATVFTDTGPGSVGAQVATFQQPSYGSSGARLGQPQISTAAATVNIGGAYPLVHTVSLFGPGAWSFTGLLNTGSSFSVCSGGWEQSVANCFSGGPAQSFGAARIDLPPTGFVQAQWYGLNVNPTTGSGPQGSALIAVPVGAGHVYNASVWVRSSGLSAAAVINLGFNEYDSTGAFLRVSPALATLTGNQPTWTQLVYASYVPGSNTSYVAPILRITDTSASGASANGTVWFDNTLCWDVTSVGMTPASGPGSMPYCELRFLQSPAQLLVSGILGDLPAPTALLWGTYLGSWPYGGTLSYAVGRRGQVSATAQLVGASVGWFDSSRGPPVATPYLDTGSYGGFYVQADANGGWNPRAFSFHPADCLGVFHLLERFKTAESLANLGNITERVVMQTKSNAWYGVYPETDQLAEFYGAFLTPLTVSNAWQVVDGGQVAIPAFAQGALTDPTQNYLSPRQQWADNNTDGPLSSANWQLLLPVDGSLVLGVANNPTNASVPVVTEWVWVYLDGLAVNTGVPAQPGSPGGGNVAWTYSLEVGPTAAPAHGAGGPGTQTTGLINVNSGADPYLSLDPTLTLAPLGAGTLSGGINQMGAYVADQAGTVLPFVADIVYSPLYLYPR